MRYLFIILLGLSIYTVSCNRIKSNSKEVINKTGETVGEVATEFVEGVTEGIDNTLACDLTLNKELISQGLSLGVFSVESENQNENNNVLRVYLIFDKDFKSQVTAIVTNKMNQETGRSKIEIEAEAGSADYYDFIFDEHTNIDVKSIVTIGG